MKLEKAFVSTHCVISYWWIHKVLHVVHDSEFQLMCAQALLCIAVSLWMRIDSFKHERTQVISQPKSTKAYHFQTQTQCIKPKSCVCVCVCCDEGLFPVKSCPAHWEIPQLCGSGRQREAHGRGRRDHGGRVPGKRIPHRPRGQVAPRQRPHSLRLPEVVRRALALSKPTQPDHQRRQVECAFDPQGAIPDQLCVTALLGFTPSWEYSHQRVLLVCCPNLENQDTLYKYCHVS